MARRVGDTIDLFFDGVIRGSTTLPAGTALSTSTNLLLLGARDGGQVFPLRGLLDEVAIWSRGLSTAEVGALFNDGQGRALPEPCAAALLGLGVGGLGWARQRRA